MVAASPKSSVSTSVTIEHELGTIEVPADSIVRLVAPLWGFDAHREFALLPAARQGLWWFISIADAPVTFVLADPFVAMDDYVVDVSDTEREELELTGEQDALALVMLTMPSSTDQPVTGNFRAPLVLNLATRCGKQIVTRDDRFELARPVDLTRYPLHDA